MRDIHISIVSHGQQCLVIKLLNDINSLSSVSRCQVSITFNIPESDPILLPEVSFPITIINNSTPKGYGANHNYAFYSPPLPDARKYYLVINPDVRVRDDVLSPLVKLIDSDSSMGVVAPLVYSMEGLFEDSVRNLPTPAILAKKLFGGESSQPPEKNYGVSKPDWVAGMFMMFRSEVFNRVGGFDERYHLYYEDVDMCSRLWLGGYSVQVARDCSIIHDARRDSRRKVKYMFWHIVSIVRFFSSDVYNKVKKLHARRQLHNA